MEEEVLSYKHAAYLVLTATETISDSTSPGEAAERIPVEKKIITQKSPDDSITYGEYALLIMKQLDIRGGILYELTESPRYAARELSFYEIPPEPISPFTTLSGKQSLQILRSVLEWKEEQQ
jgi:hypothetical protein